MSRKDGIERTVEAIRHSLDYAEERKVILCMENHYKDGAWQYSEFAQPEDMWARGSHRCVLRSGNVMARHFRVRGRTAVIGWPY